LPIIALVEDLVHLFEIAKNKESNIK